MKDFEKVSEAKAELIKRLKALHGSKDKGIRKLHKTLSKCRKRQRCGSAACPICFRLFRRWLYAQLVNLVGTIPGARIMTIVFYSEMVTDKELDSFNITRLHNRLRKQLKRCGFTMPVVGGFEIDFHEEEEVWVPHYHLLIFDNEPVERLRNILKGPTNERMSEIIARPMLVQEIKNRQRQLSYLCKSYCARVKAFPSLITGKRITRKYRLRDEQQRLILKKMDSIGFKEILFLYNARRRGVGEEVISQCVSSKKFSKGRTKP